MGIEVAPEFNYLKFNYFYYYNNIYIKENIHFY